MLQQMGYQAGQGLGRSVLGSAEPLDLNLKAGRTGLGVDEDRKRRQLESQLGQKSRGGPLGCRCWAEPLADDSHRHVL